jgi:MFS family permease
VSGADATPWPSERRGWLVVGVLCACAIVSFIDRQIINLLVEDLKRDLAITDTRISLLQGLAFALFYATCAIPLGRLADVANRKRIVLGGLLVWTLATGGCGLAASFTHLFVARVLVGVGEATLTPNTFSMLADLFPPKRLALPCSVFTGASFVGSAVALLGGGALLGHLATVDPLVLPVVGELKVWQAAFLLAALPGVFVAILLVLFVREPVRRGSVANVPVERPSLRDVAAFYRRNLRALNAVFFGVSLLGAVQFSIGAWGPAYFMRVHHWTPPQVGFAYGTILLICGTGGAIAGGWLADRLEARHGQGHLRTALISAFGTIPFVIAFPLASSGTAAALLLAPVVFVGSLSLGAGPALIPVLAAPRMRGVLVASYLFAASLIGQAAGPWLVAACTDFVFGTPAAVRYSLVIVPVVLLLLSAAFLGSGLRAGATAARRATEAAPG